MQTNRLFFALLPNDEARDACHKAFKELLIRMAPVQRRIIPPENYHITLEFLGSSVTAEQQSVVRHSAAEVSGEPFEFVLDMASSFADAKVWWLGPRDAPPVLIQLRSELHRRLNGLGLHLNRGRYTPHVTVLKTSEKLATTRIASICWKATEFALMRSEMGTEGTRYTMVEKWPLTAKSPTTEGQSPQLTLI